ncbi:MAG: filamentous hemagglutinin N-terminal domain-containing protein [Burkholderiaceae bacterium]
MSWVAPTAAQVVLDGSVGPGGALTGPDYRIDAALGAQRGSNLFHSFERFGLASGERAVFAGPNGISNIIARVTGGTSSRIDGTLASEIAGANLFLLNPAGIAFGPNASISIPGGLYLSTANRLLFTDGTHFDTDGGTAPLLSSAPPSAFGFVDARPMDIRFSGVHRSDTNAPFGPGAGAAPGADLHVSAGNIDLEDGIDASGARVAGQLVSTVGHLTLHAIGGPGEVAITPNPAAPANGRVAIGGSSRVLQQDGRGILIRGGEILVSDSASIVSRSYLNPEPGDLELSARDIRLQGDAQILSLNTLSAPGATLRLRASGRFEMGADIADQSGYLPVAQVGSGTFGPAPAGDVRIEAGAIVLRGLSIVASQSAASGNGGRVSLVAGQSIELGDVAAVFSYGTSTGRPGTILVRAPQVAVLGDAGIGGDALAAGASASADILVSAPQRLRVASSGGITATTTGAADAGSITIKAGELDIERGFVAATSSAAGSAGRIDIDAATLTIGASAEVATGARADGHAGDITIRANRLVVAGGRIEAASGTQGSVSTSVGRAGSIRIDADTMTMDGGAVNASTASAGDAGNVVIRVRALDMHDGELYSTSGGAGGAGGVDVRASSRVALSGTALVRSNALDAGTAGSVRIVAPDIELDGRLRIETRTIGDRPAGNVTIEADRVRVAGGAQVSSSSGFRALDTGDVSVGNGAGGNVIIVGRENVAFVGRSNDGFAVASGALAETLGPGPAGTIEIRTPALTMRDGAQVRTDTSGTGDAGSIAIHADVVTLAGGSAIRASSDASGRAGDVLVQASDSVHLTGASSIATEAAASDGGNLTVNAARLVFLDGARISTSVGGAGNGGNVRIDPQFVVLQRDARIIAQAVGGSGGNVAIFITNGGALLASTQSLVSASSEFGVDGTVRVDSPGQDVGSALLSLPIVYIDAAGLVRSPCAARRARTESSLVVRPLAGAAGPAPSTTLVDLWREREARFPRRPSDCN